jgi:hypothetical protein
MARKLASAAWGATAWIFDAAANTGADGSRDTNDTRERVVLNVFRDMVILGGHVAGYCCHP